MIGLLPLALVLGTTPDLDARVRLHGATCSGPPLSDRVHDHLESREDAPTLEADATLQQRDDGQWQLDLELSRGDEASTVRTFVAPDCSTAIDAAALVIALAMDPANELPRDPPTPELPALPEPVASTREPSKPATPVAGDRTAAPPGPTPTKPRLRGIRGLLRAGGGVDGGALPGAAAFFEAAAGALGRGWRAEATGMVRLQSTKHARLDPSVGARFSVWALGARVCGVPKAKLARGGALEFPLCAAIEGGRMVAEGFGFTNARTTRRPWGAALFGPGLAWAPRPNVALVLQAALGVPMIRSEIAIDGLERLHVTGPVFGRAWLGFEGRFP